MNRREMIFGGVAAAIGAATGKATASKEDVLTVEKMLNRRCGRAIGEPKGYKLPTVEESAEKLLINGFGPWPLESSMNTQIDQEWPKDLFTIDNYDFRYLLAKIPDKINPSRLTTAKFCCDMYETYGYNDPLTGLPPAMQVPFATMPTNLYMRGSSFSKRVTHYFNEALKDLIEFGHRHLRNFPSHTNTIVFVKPKAQAEVKDDCYFSFHLVMHVFGHSDINRDYYQGILAGREGGEYAQATPRPLV